MKLKFSQYIYYNMPTNKKKTVKMQLGNMTKNAWENMFWGIKRKWARETELMNGWFIQHLDGNTLNDSIDNLRKIHPREVFARLANDEELVVDWVCGLTKKEIAFVKINADKFRDSY